MDKVRDIQHSINRDFRMVNRRMEEIQLEHVKISKVYEDGTITSSSMPLLVATVSLANQAESILAFLDNPVTILESNSISKAIMEELIYLFKRLIKACQDNYAGVINDKEIVLIVLISSMAVLIGISFIVMIVLVLKVVSKKNSAIATLAYVSDADIKQIIDASRSISMSDNDQKIELNVIKEDDYVNDHNVATNKGIVHSKTVDLANNSVTNGLNATAIALKEQVKRKYDYIKYSE